MNLDNFCEKFEDYCFLKDLEAEIEGEKFIEDINCIKRLNYMVENYQ